MEVKRRGGSEERKRGQEGQMEKQRGNKGREDGGTNRAGADKMSEKRVSNGRDVPKMYATVVRARSGIVRF